MSEAPIDRDDNVVRLVAPAKGTIRVLAGRRHIAADQGLRALSEANVQFFQRDQALVRCTRSPAKASDGTVIYVPSIVPVTTPIIARELGKVSDWEKINAKNKTVPIDPPWDVVEQIAAMQGEWPFDPLAGVIGTPTLRPDGSILDQPGYDQATGLFLIDKPDMPAMPEHPGYENASDALETLSGLLSEFPFVVEADGTQLSRSVAMSMILTAVLRAAIPPCAPMHVITAPEPGSGKSYLSDIASAIATGERCPVVANAPKPDETEKRLVGCALSGFPIISLDNVNDVLTGDFLAQVTERPVLNLRALGASAMVRVPNTFTLFANGNNITATADMVRRTVRASLDSNRENPEERNFAQDPVAMVMANRGTYIAACLTIGRAYILAGRPDRRPRLPSFGAWSDTIRSALCWLGWSDPVASMDLSRADDPVRQTRAAIFDAWEREIGIGERLKTADLIELASAWATDGHVRPTLYAALRTICGSKTSSALSPDALGKWLRANGNTRSGDLKLVPDRSDAKRPRWVLTKA